jgi:hypothetical protein
MGAFAGWLASWHGAGCTGGFTGRSGTWAAIAGNHSIIIVVIIGKNVIWVVAASLVLADQRQLTDDFG